MAAPGVWHCAPSHAATPCAQKPSQQGSECIPALLDCCMPPVAQAGVVDSETLLTYLKQHGGHCLSWSTLQPNIQHFVLPGIGFMAFVPTTQPAWSKVQVLGDPVCDPSQREQLLMEFMAEHRRATFWQISHSFASFLSQQLGYEVNCMGGETQIAVKHFRYSGNMRKSLRLAAARCAKAGVVVQEEEAHPLQPAVAHQLRQVNQEWMLSKAESAQTAWFLVRPPMFEQEPPGTRTFVAWECQVSNEDGSGGVNANGHVHVECGAQLKAVGFIVLDPMYKAGRLVGWYANVTRTSGAAHPGTAALMMQVILDVLKREDAAAEASAGHLGSQTSDPHQGLVLSLGMSPLYCLKEDIQAFTHNKAVAALYRWIYNHGCAFYPYQGIAASKARYGGGTAVLERTGQYEDPAVRWERCWMASGAGWLCGWEQYQAGLTMGMMRGVISNLRIILQDVFRGWCAAIARKSRRMRSKA